MDRQIGRKLENPNSNLMLDCFLEKTGWAGAGMGIGMLRGGGISLIVKMIFLCVSSCNGKLPTSQFMLS